MSANPNFSTSVSAEKAAALKDYAGMLDLDIEDDGAGYCIKNYSAAARPQTDADPDGPWTITCPPDQAASLRELMDKSPEFIE